MAKNAKAIGDGAYDTKSNFRYLDGKGMKPAIKVRRNSSSSMVETVFFTFKRTFGEYVSAKKMENMMRELTVRANLYNAFIGLTANL